MSAADHFADELTHGANALSAVPNLLTTVAPDSGVAIAVQDPRYLAHALTNLRHASAEVEFIALALHRRAMQAAHQDRYPATVRDLLTTLATGLRAAMGEAHTLWRLLRDVEDHGYALKTATPGRPAVTAIGDRVAAETTTTATALVTAHTILAGLSQDYYGGRAVLSATILAHALATLRQITATLAATLRALHAHANHLAHDPTSTGAVGELATALTGGLSAATVAARQATQVLRRLDHQAHELQNAAQGIAFTL